LKTEWHDIVIWQLLDVTTSLHMSERIHLLGRQRQMITPRRDRLVTQPKAD
jgi:hypothetical protein